MKEITYKVKIDANGDKEWYVNDKLHREDGPAVEWSDGDRAWYVKDVRLTEKQFNERNKQSKKINKPRIAILVRGGVVQEVYATFSPSETKIIDVDDLQESKKFSNKELEKYIAKEIKGFRTCRVNNY